MDDMNVPMINPMIVNKTGQYETEEGCLSLMGVRKTNRFKEIEVDILIRDLRSEGENTQVGLLKLFNMK